LSHEERSGNGAGFEVIVVGLDGQIVERRMVAVRLAKMEYDRSTSQWLEVEKSVLERVLNSTSEPVQTWFDLEDEGSYKIAAYILDDKGRKSRTEIDFQYSPHVEGLRTLQGKRREVPGDVVTEPDAQIDKDSYAPGETALLTVQTPVVPVQGLLLVSAGGLVQKEHFVMTEHEQVLQIPVREVFIPRMTVHVFLNGGLRDALQEPFEFSRSHPILVSAARRLLNVKIEPEKTILAPGDSMDLRLSVADSSSAPAAGAEVAAWMVDESVLALVGRNVEQDPFTFFHNLPYFMTGLDYARRMVSSDNMMILDPDLYGSMLDESGSFGGISDNSLSARPYDYMADHSLLVRQDFNPCALFVGSAKTDAEGVVTLPVQMPDNLTRYRVVAYAASGDHSFGMQTSSVIAKQSISVIPSAPRFLRLGDQCMLPVLVHNRTDRPMRVSVAARGRNLELTEAAGYALTVPAMDRVEVSFPARPLRAGTAVFNAIVRGEAGSDAVEISIPVYTPATSEAFALYGDMEQGVVSQPVRVPEDVFPEYGGFQFTTASTRMQGLTDAFLYLVRYPYDCAEQRASRMLAIAALEPVLRAFDVEGIPDREELLEFLRDDIQGLAEIQKEDGGFGFWAGGSWPSNPFLSAHVAHALVRVRDQWQLSDGGMLDRILEYLDSEDSSAKTGGWTSARAYLLYARTLAGQSVGEQAMALLDSVGIEEINLEAAGWLLTALNRGNVNAEAEIARLTERILNSVEETAATAHFAVGYRFKGGGRSAGRTKKRILAEYAGERILPACAETLFRDRGEGRAEFHGAPLAEWASRSGTGLRWAFG
jgi:uncharacterized protein YfaS (alpha-2-macroglobulin family)